jgi:hypothetical protein
MRVGRPGHYPSRVPTVSPCPFNTELKTFCLFSRTRGSVSAQESPQGRDTEPIRSLCRPETQLLFRSSTTPDEMVLPAQDQFGINSSCEWGVRATFFISLSFERIVRIQHSLRSRLAQNGFRYPRNRWKSSRSREARTDWRLYSSNSDSFSVWRSVIFSRTESCIEWHQHNLYHIIWIF